MNLTIGMSLTLTKRCSSGKNCYHKLDAVTEVCLPMASSSLSVAGRSSRVNPPQFCVTFVARCLPSLLFPSLAPLARIQV